MTKLRALLPLAVLALSSLLYYRIDELRMLWVKRPGNLPSINTFGKYEIKFADRVRSCEDAMVLEDHGVAIMACDPGRERWNTVMGIFAPGPVASADLYIYDYKDATAPDSKSLRQVKLVNFSGKGDFHSLGIAYDAKLSVLYVANHAKAGSRIETFNLDIENAVAKHISTIQHPLIRGPNAIAIINSKEFYVTNDHHFLAKNSKLLARMETLLGLPFGTVVHVKLREGKTGEVEDANIVTRLAFANGIQILDTATVAVASSSRAAVRLYTPQKEGKFIHKKTISVPFLPDNLSVHGGKLMIAGHPHLPTLAKFTATRRICNDPKELLQASEDVKDYCKTGTAGSWVAEWTESSGLKTLYVGTEYPSSCTAARDVDRGVGIVSGLYAKGILVWRD